MPELPSAAEVARGLADALEEAGIPYAIGGAIALGYHSTPRATIDVDLNVFLDPMSDIERIVEVLHRGGFEPDAETAALKRQAVQDGQFRGRATGIRVDVFVPSVPYYAELRERSREAVLMGRPIRILGADDLAVLKMMFFRTKDLADVEALLLSPEANLDRAFVREKIVRLMGDETDERVRAWDELVTRLERRSPGEAD